MIPVETDIARNTICRMQISVAHATRQQSKNLLVLPKLLKITLNIINLNIYVYFVFFKLYSITVINV